ncbi:MAG: UDP-N-acetylmuramate dehydrogenase [Eubacteriales bacterium]|nr:UDP-N-acetylmuramate dehydrogenase [Eubacteriales bacterium]
MTEIEEFYGKLCELVGKENVLRDEKLSAHVTFRIGGPADYFVTPHTCEEVAAVIHTCREAGKDWYILGNGSNLLVSDRGYRGVIIQLFKNFNEITVEDFVVTAQAGAQNAVLARRALEAGLAGYEFAAGIPGTVGGAVVMNAGAYGGEMKDVLTEVTVLDEHQRLRVLRAEELELGYRTSIIAKKGYVVLQARLRLHPGDPAQIRERMNELRDQRVSKQPLEYPSAGSTFKRPEGYFAGKLIMDAGLRGFSVGDAQVSEKHCGFVINRGNATAADVDALMQEVIRRVREQFGVTLEPEVKRLGE